MDSDKDCIQKDKDFKGQRPGQRPGQGSSITAILSVFLLLLVFNVDSFATSCVNPLTADSQPAKSVEVRTHPPQKQTFLHTPTPPRGHQHTSHRGWHRAGVTYRPSASNTGRKTASSGEQEWSMSSSKENRRAFFNGKLVLIGILIVIGV